MQHPDDVITLLDEDGHEHQFNIMNVLEVESQRYAVLLPLDEGEESDEAVIMRVESDTLVTIDDEDEFDRVVAALEEDDEELDPDDDDEEEEDDDDDEGDLEAEDGERS